MTNKKWMIDNPYADVDWTTWQTLDSVSHQHTDLDKEQDPWLTWETLVQMGYQHLLTSDYYPSAPRYPLPAAFREKYPEVLGGPNAEHHSFTDFYGLHVNGVGSWLATGYGKHFKGNDLATSPAEVVFDELVPFDPKENGQGMYTLSVVLAPKEGMERPPSARLTVTGALECDPRTFLPLEENPIIQRLITYQPNAKASLTVTLRAKSDRIGVRLSFPEDTRIERVYLHQGSNKPVLAVVRAALDGTRQDAEGRPLEGLLYADGGGITLNHPSEAAEEYFPLLDAEPRILGIEVWSHRSAFGRLREGQHYYRVWDEILRSGRRCLGFFVKDHRTYGRGRNVLLVPPRPVEEVEERERDALKAYRRGSFFGSIGAPAVNDAGELMPPYDYSTFRFTELSVEEDEQGRPRKIRVCVGGQDRTRRPHVQIRFITEVGIAHIVDTEEGEASFAVPMEDGCRPACTFVRVEAFAYPKTHAQGQVLTKEAMSKLNVLEIAQLHDTTSALPRAQWECRDPEGNSAIGIVDMIFSQPIRFL